MTSFKIETLVDLFGCQHVKCSRGKTIFISHQFSKHLAPVNVGSVEAEEKRTTWLFVGWKVMPCPAQSRKKYLGICGLDLLKTVLWRGQIFVWDPR